MIKRGNAFYKEEWIAEMAEYIRKYNYSHQEIITELENKIKEYTGRKFAVAVNSGSNAIYMCLFLFCKEGNVIVPNWGYPGVINACKSVGVEIKTIDIKEETLCMNPEFIKKTITKDTKAIINIGNSGIIGRDIAEIKNIAKSNGSLFIEDAAPSFIQEFDGKKAGTFGDLGIFSFSPTKPIICGEGGVIVTDSEEMDRKLRVFRHMTYSSCGSNFKCYIDDNTHEGSLNFSLSPFLAAYILPQLSKSNLNEIISLRERIHSQYKKYINVFNEEGVTNRYGNIMYLSDNAEEISNKFNSLGIDHRYKYYPLYKNGFSVSESIFERLIDLPSGCNLTGGEITFICKMIQRIENE